MSRIGCALLLVMITASVIVFILLTRSDDPKTVCNDHGYSRTVCHHE